MATYRVIKAHDGLKVGDLRVLDPCPVAYYMVDNGYWEVYTDKSAGDGSTAIATKENTKKSKKK